MPYWRLFYHIVWTTKERLPFIEPHIENKLYPILIAKCDELRGQAYAVNGMPDHVHVVAAAPASLSPAIMVKHLKGASSHFIRETLNPDFMWQAGYGIFTISERNIRHAVLYVRGQKEHHACGSLIRRLEYTSNDDEGPPRVDSDAPEWFMRYT